MRLRVSARVLLCLAAAGCGRSQTVAVDRPAGRAVRERRVVPAFTHVDLEGAGILTVTAGGSQTVEVSADAGLIRRVHTKVTGDTLTIWVEGQYDSPVGVSATVSAPVIEGVRLSGSGDVAATGLAGRSVDASVAGSGRLTLSGSCPQLAAVVDGSGALRALDLSTETASVRVVGSGDAEVAPGKSLDARVDGSGSISYRGAPRVKQAVSGSGAVRHIP